MTKGWLRQTRQPKEGLEQTAGAAPQARQIQVMGLDSAQAPRRRIAFPRALSDKLPRSL